MANGPDLTAPRRTAWMVPIVALWLAAVLPCPPAAGQASQTAPDLASSGPATQPDSGGKVKSPPWKPDAGGTSGPMWQMLGSVVLILFLGGAAYVVVKRVLPRIAASAGKDVRVLETTPLGRNSMVHLLKVGSDRFLVASSREAVALLAKVTESFAEPAGASREPRDRSEAT